MTYTHAGLSRADIARRFSVAAQAVEIPRVLKNTFLVLTDDCLFPQLDTIDLDDHIEPTESGFLFDDPQRHRKRTVPLLFVWAYDATWVPPGLPQVADLTIVESSGDCACQPRPEKCQDHVTELPEDEYQGRVKVDITILFSWFYYARLMEIDLKDMWKRAQKLPGQVWTCQAAIYDPSQPGALV